MNSTAKKVAVISATIIAGSIFLTSGVSAQNRQATRAAEKQENRLDRIKDRSNHAIDQRLQHLGQTKTRVEGAKYLLPESKTVLLQEIATTSAALETHRAKIAADTDTTVALTDYRKIFSEYRVYLVITPHIRASAMIDHVEKHILKMEAFGMKLQRRIQQATDDGANTAVLTSQYNQYTTKVANAKTKIASAKTALGQLTVANFASNKQTLATLRKNLKSAADDLKEAHRIAADIVSSIKTAKADRTATQSATPPAGGSAKP